MAGNALVGSGVSGIASLLLSMQPDVQHPPELGSMVLDQGVLKLSPDSLGGLLLSPGETSMGGFVTLQYLHLEPQYTTAQALVGVSDTGQSSSGQSLEHSHEIPGTALKDGDRVLLLWSGPHAAIIIGCVTKRPLDGSGSSSGDGGGSGGGSAGPPGPAGPAGPAGPSGPAGAQGSSGPTGPSGAIGPQGPLGGVGPQGATGVQGAAGATGPTGPAGTGGATGPAGPQGAAGLGLNLKGTVTTLASLPPTGNTTNDAWVTTDTGFLWVWNGSTWVNTGASRGPAGPTGPQGVAGPAGATGPQGAVGPAGTAGAVGANGPTGPAGPQGATGAAGPTGPAGPQGVAGPAGGIQALGQGSAAAPSLAFYADSSTGVFSAGLPGSISLTGGGVEGLRVTGAQVYLPGYLQLSEITPPPTPVAGRLSVYSKSDHKLYYLDSTGTETLVGAGNLSITGGTLTGPLRFSPNNTNDIGGAGASPRDVYVGRNLIMSGTAARMTADFSSAVATRTFFQTTTANSATCVSALPTGTGVISTWRAYNNPTLTNASFVEIYIDAGEARVNSDREGTGTYLPLGFFTGANERMRLSQNGATASATTIQIGGNPNERIRNRSSSTARTTYRSSPRMAICSCPH